MKPKTIDGELYNAEFIKKLKRLISSLRVEALRKDIFELAIALSCVHAVLHEYQTLLEEDDNAKSPTSKVSD